MAKITYIEWDGTRHEVDVKPGMTTSVTILTQDVPEHPALVQLTGIYHNLLRRWAEP